MGTNGQKRPTGLRILVVENDSDCADSLAILLGLYGHRVSVASNGRDSLELARTCDLDVIILDICMPGMDGYELARRLREQTTAHRPLLIAVTGLAQQEARQHSAEAGIDLHLVKPADPEQLRDLLQRFEDCCSA